MRLARLVVITAVNALILTVGTPTGASSEYPVLHDSRDPKLQQDLETTLNLAGFSSAIKDKQLSLALVDITDLKRPRVAAVNENTMFYAASLPKIAILLGAFKLIEDGEMTLDQDVRKTLTDMIRVSSNKAATKMFQRVGPERLANILQSPQYRLYDPSLNGGLWCGKAYGKIGAWRRDPLHNLSHGATALQAARFYYLLETQQLVSPALTEQMKDILSKPGIKHKFVKGLVKKRGAEIFRKSGSWKRWHADSAIVEEGQYKYIVVALAEHSNGGKWLERVIEPIHDLIVPHDVPVAQPN
jgi:beta-lactamase class A